ncbi:hypothetical protein ACE1AT_07300 [Pelatocladus sp. BLCC-F211]|uniref:hypothetical protein n=1 Tax=Pelatocladus sp. BLCC-F211 TaxID=3342752 RepID=UPI0035BA5C42
MFRNQKCRFGDWGLGIGDWGLGIGDWGTFILLSDYLVSHKPDRQAIADSITWYIISDDLNIIYRGCGVNSKIQNPKSQIE